MESGQGRASEFDQAAVLSRVTALPSQPLGRCGLADAEGGTGWPSSPRPLRHFGRLGMALEVALAARLTQSSASGTSSLASLENAVSALRIAPSLVANANTVLRDGTSTSSAYHNVLLPLCRSTLPVCSLS